MITSTSNPTVKELARLRNRRERDRSGTFVIEGKRPVAVAAAAGVGLIQQVVCPDLGADPIGGVPVVEMAEEPFRRVSIRQNPDGILALARHLDTNLTSLSVPARPLLLVVESIEKPGNLGAILRTADALGADGVVTADPTTDVHNPNAVRASQGALFTVPLAVASVGEVRPWLESRGVPLLAATPAAGRAPWEVDLHPPVAIAIGAEDTGLSAGMLEAAAGTVTIPMRGTVDSLNASVAAALLLYEAIRRRDQG